jgi:hypothetical protein
MKPANVELHIAELVLHGFAPGDRYRIGETIERELARLFAEQGTSQLLRQRSEIERLDGGAFEVKPGIRAEAIGAQVAQTVYRGLAG